eukprot:g13601.t1
MSAAWRGQQRRGGGGGLFLSWAGFAFASWALLLARAKGSTAAGVTAAADGVTSSRSVSTATTFSESTITRLAFGSCNKQYLPQPMWKSVEELSPDVWLWIGDAVYVDKFSDGGVEKMREAISRQLENKDYQRFLSKVPRVEGVWDDHDYGVNDAGKELSDHPGRVAAFLDFLGAPADDPRRGGATLYSSHDFGEAPKKVRVILLDIRTQRDGYHAFNIAHRKFKFAAMIGAMLRWFSGSFCLGSDYAGSVIGEDQWEWLQGQLENSDASVHVLVSTLQVLTSNPLVESWGHFPHSRKRLLDLLHRTNPAGLVILSGDVHHAELASGWRTSNPPDVGVDVGAGAAESEPSTTSDADLPPGHPPIESDAKSSGAGAGCPFAKRGGAASAAEPSGSGPECAAHSGVGGAAGSGEGRGVVEVTTSGMTHSCLSTHGKMMCEAYLDRWRQHRWREDAFFLDSNFGDIEIEWDDGESAYQPAKMAVTVRDVSGNPILPVIEHFGGPTADEEASGEEGASRRSHRAAGFPPSADDTAAAPGGARERRTPTEDRERRPLGRTFLDRSPPPECVEAVLPGGCTARKVSAVAACLLALVLSWVGLCRGASALSTGRGKRRAKAEKSPPVAASSSAAGGLRRKQQQQQKKKLRATMGPSMMSMIATDQDDSAVAAEGTHAAPPKQRPAHAHDPATATAGNRSVGGPGTTSDRKVPSQHQAAAAAATTNGAAGRNGAPLGKINGGDHKATATAPTLSARGGKPVGGRGGGGRGVRRRRPGEGRGRGGAGGNGSGAKRNGAAFTRSRDFVLKVRGMSRWNWRGVLEALEIAEEEEARFAETERGTEGASNGTPSAHAYNSCLMHLARCARWREALALFDRMSAKGVTPNSFCLNATLDACAAAGEWRQCLAVLERAKASGLEVNEFSYNICIAACGSGKQWRRALTLLREIEEAGKAGTATPPTMGTYGATIKALGMSGKWRESVEIFREVQALGGSRVGAGVDGAATGDVVPDVVMYTTLITALGQSGRTAEAKQIWEEMVASGVRPNIVTYHAMIAAYGNAAAAKAATSTEASATAAAAAPAGRGAPGSGPPPASPPPPPPREADWAEAIRLLNEMPLAGIAHTSSSYGAAITAAGQCGLWEEAVALLERMRESSRASAAELGAVAETSGVRPKGPPLAPNNFIYTAAIRACGDNGQWEQALRLVNEMPADRVETDMMTYSATITALAKASRLEEAFRLMREMSEEHGLAPTPVAYEGILEAYGRKDKARAEELIAFVRGGGGMGKPDFFTYSVAIAVCAAAAAASARPTSAADDWRGHTNEAPALLREMAAAGLSPDESCFTNALSACRDRGDGNEAVAILREMDEAGVAPDSVVYTLVMAACGSSGNWEGAVSLVREMKGKGMPPNLISYSVAVSACAKAGQHGPALELMREMKAAGISPNTVTYSSAILACTASGQWEPAVDLLREMPRRGLSPSRTCYAPAIKACAQGGNADMALSLLREMPKVGLSPDALCYAAALSALRDDCDRSAALLREMREVGLAPSSVLYVNAVRACKAAGKLDQADLLETELSAVVGRARASSSLLGTGGDE